MNAVPPPVPDFESRTLADILYTEKAKLSVPEGEWAALVGAIAGGDPLALRELFERSHYLVFVFFLRVTRRPEYAEELTLDVFEDVWVKARQYDEEQQTVLGWLMSHARPRALEFVRFDHGKGKSTSTPPCSSGDLPRQATMAGKRSNGSAALEELRRSLRYGSDK